MTTYIRWRDGLGRKLEYFEPTGARWVPCDRQMYGFFLKEGPVHLNPTVNPAVALLGELQEAK